MNYVYKLTVSTVTSEDGTAHTTFGIEAYKKGEANPCRIIPDIFTSREAAEDFIRACNLLGLDIDHLDDVVYDVINA